MTAATRSTGHGVTFRCSVRGILTEPARQGFRAINPSSTAAARTADTLAKITRTYDAANCSCSPRTQAWMTEGRRSRNWRRPR
jgi:hypothetical protein